MKVPRDAHRGGKLTMVRKVVHIPSDSGENIQYFERSTPG